MKACARDNKRQGRVASCVDANPGFVQRRTVFFHLRQRLAEACIGGQKSVERSPKTARYQRGNNCAQGHRVAAHSRATAPPEPT